MAASLDETMNGKSVNIKVGTTFSVLLHSTYWNLDPVPNSNLAQVGAAKIIPIAPGPSAPAGCKMPGMGCGTVEWTFKAKRAGLTKLSFSRTSCGEAMRCDANSSSYIVRIKIGKAKR
jgi:hypothetical protein